MPNQIMLFESTEVRFIPDNDSFWVVGSDVLKALEYSESSTPAQVFMSIPDEVV